MKTYKSRCTIIALIVIISFVCSACALDVRKHYIQLNIPLHQKYKVNIGKTKVLHYFDRYGWSQTRRIRNSGVYYYEVEYNQDHLNKFMYRTSIDSINQDSSIITVLEIMSIKADYRYKRHGYLEDEAKMKKMHPNFYLKVFKENMVDKLLNNAPSETELLRDSSFTGI